MKKINYYKIILSILILNCLVLCVDCYLQGDKVNALELDCAIMAIFATLYLFGIGIEEGKFPHITALLKRWKSSLQKHL